MIASEACYDLIKHFEGCRLEPYFDLTGNLTVGYGHKLDGVYVPVEGGFQRADGHFVSVITPEQAEMLLRQDVALTENGVNRLTDAFDLTQGQFDALVSFAYNEGLHALQTSHLLSYTRLREYDRAAAEFGKWDKAGGVTVAGLATRRAAERDLFLL